MQFLDYGNTVEVSAKDVRVIPASDATFEPLRALPPLATRANVSFLKALRADHDSANAAIDAVWEFAEAEAGLHARVDYSAGGTPYVTLARAANYVTTLQEALLRAGLAQVDQRAVAAGKALPGEQYAYLFRTIASAVDAARRSHAGVFEFGDAFTDDDDE